MSADHAATLRQAAAAMSADPQLIHRIPFTTLAGLLTVQLEDEARWADARQASRGPCVVTAPRTEIRGILAGTQRLLDDEVDTLTDALVAVVARAAFHAADQTVRSFRRDLDRLPALSSLNLSAWINGP